MTVLRRVLLVCVILSTPAIAHAQEAVLTGTVTDTTGGVLPGVTVTAILEATGNKFVATTDAGGHYRIPVRVGVYKITAELPGFSTVTRTGTQLLVGQAATINLQMSLGAVAESVTVTGESPLISTTTSSLGSNVDPRQVQELPVNGRNFMALALLAPGSRTTSESAITPMPDRGSTNDIREFQMNVDGQQVSADIGTGSQPKYSQDAIAEFQFIANRFDATMGRSTGVQVNVVTKSGTNQLSGLLRSNFRNSRFNAQNPIFGRVVPIDNQQISSAAGGPVVKDRLHYFGNFEYEREPRVATWNTPYPAFNVSLTGTNNIKKGGLRLDYQLSPSMRLMGKFSKTTTWQPFEQTGGQDHPAGANTNGDYNRESYARFTQVLSNHAMNEIEGGQAVYGFHQEPLTTWNGAWYAKDGFPVGSPRIRFKGFGILPNRNIPRHQDQWVWNVRDNLTFSYDAKGRHDLKVGGEFMTRHQIQANRRNSTGEIDARKGLPANIQQLFPDPFNVDTWNLAAISSITRSVMIGVGNFNNNIYTKKAAAWAQDDWEPSDRVTLNLGLRYDVAINAFANKVAFPPFQQAGRPIDWWNFQPRLGFVYKVSDRMVVRGGAGLYYGDAMGNDSSTATGNTIISQIRYENDGRPDFAANPTNGRPLPTYQEAEQQYCYANNNAKGCLLRDVSEVVGPFQYVHLPRTFQTSIGFQRQFGNTIALEADYVYSRGSHEKSVIDNINLTFNPATGANYPFTNRATRAYPDWGVVSMSVHTGRSAYHALRTAVTKRFGRHWQAGATYTLSGLWDGSATPFSGLQPVAFATAKDLGGEWSLSQFDQRHRAVFNAVWQVGRGFQVSGLQYVGAGIRQPHTYGGDLRDTGGSSARLRPDGTIVPRNDIIAPPQSRTDLRLQQKIPLPGHVSLDGIIEVFNLFNRPNWGIGTEEDRADFLKHISAEYRTMQVGFRLTF